MSELLIRNGLVYEPVQHRFIRKDIAVSGGTIVTPESCSAAYEIDAAGCLVTPGLIDFHLHCSTQTSNGAYDADLFCLPNGTTTCVDAGTTGTAGYERFYEETVCREKTRILALVHVAPEGLSDFARPENQDPARWEIRKMEQLCAEHPEIAGIKLRLGHGLTGPLGLKEEELLSAAAELGEHLGKRMVVHVNDPGIDTGAIAGMLRAGDVFCHMYAGREENILTAEGNVKEEIRRARSRGVLFDACNGRGNFLFQVAEPAIRAGFLPDVISSDNTVYGNYRHPLISLPRILSKYLMLGMSLEDVLDCATLVPARWLYREELATLEAGTCADIAVWKLKEGDYTFRDVSGEQRTGHQMLTPQMTIRDGEIVYAQSDFQ